MDALIIKKPWINLILNGAKVWELRGSKTHKRGKIELIQSQSGLVVGSCLIVDCFELTKEIYYKGINYHHVKLNFYDLPYKKTFAWVISDATRYEKPRKYFHPKGAVIWVKL